ncbi:GlxA family transcriptional regulator [Aliikangiella sp. IMCC44359]|uniref:GlxA family transcriptional regulator n=1 Tax=Aliikangiella sp. IMCC44359 TaxID=3459125 RepID=UPI00403AE096
MKEVAILVSDNCVGTSVIGPIDVFNIANQIWSHLEPDAAPLFHIRVVSKNIEPVKTSSGAVINPDTSLSKIEYCDFLLVPSYYHQSINKRGLDEFVIKQRENYKDILRLHQRGTMIGGSCTGTFILGDCGLLDNAYATTSWWLQKQFVTSFPKAHLSMDELVVEHNNILSAGSTTSYLNLCLRVIERLVGKHIANLASKILLIDHNRSSQIPFMTLVDNVRSKDDVIAKCQDWLQSNLANPITLEDMSNKSAMSKRNFIRRFKKAVGETPVTYLQRLRVEAAKRYLETTNLKLEQILEKVGYEDMGAFRKVFQKYTALTPKAYRVKFSLSVSNAN